MKTHCALMLTLLMLSLPLASAQPSTPRDDIEISRDEVEIVRDDELGFVKLRFGDAEMSIDYDDGTISLMTVQTRSLGIADLYDEDRRFERRVSIPVKHIMWQRLVGTLEYVDTNENGLFDIDGNHGTLQELEDTAGEHEAILRAVDYGDVEWTLSEWVESRAGNDVEIDFVLSASDVAYVEQKDATVESISYLFHVTTVEQVIQVGAVPHYRVDYRGEPTDPEIAGSELRAHSDVTGRVLNSTWKYDQHIEGWDVSERNDTRLFTVTEMAMGAKIHPAVGDWMRAEYGHLVRPKAFADHRPPAQEIGDVMQDDHDLAGNPLRCGLAYVGDADGDGRATTAEERQRVLDKIRHYEGTACRQRGEEIAAGDLEKPEAIRAGSIRFNDGGASLGQIRWVSNATIDDVETEVLFQVHGARPVIPADVEDKQGLFIGVRMLGGYNYVAGNDSYHDPEFGAEVMTFDTMGFGEPIDGKNRALPIRLTAIAAVLLIVLVAMGTVSRRRAEAPMPGPSYAPTGGWTSAGADWERYRED